LQERGIRYGRGLPEDMLSLLDRWRRAGEWEASGPCEPP
jgi:hypothetical protein